MIDEVDSEEVYITYDIINEEKWILPNYDQKRGGTKRFPSNQLRGVVLFCECLGNYSSYKL